MLSKLVLRFSSIASRYVPRSQFVDTARFVSFQRGSTNQSNQKPKSSSRSLTKIDVNSSQGKKSRNGYKYLLAASLLSYFSDDDTYAVPQKKYIIHLKRTYPFLEIKGEEPKPETPEEMLIMTLKRSVYAMQQEKYEVAEQMLHLALRMAQDMQDADGITYCYDIMANLALEMEKYEKSEKLFVIVMQRLLAKGHQENDNKILHMSAKVSRIAAMQGHNQKAEQGFQWVIDGIQKRRKNEPDDNDLYELLGLVRDW